MADITRIGREHLAVHGAAALSLRAVARDLGVVSSAVYRYVKSRDDLLTLLIIDGYNALGDAVDAALAAAPFDDPAERFRVIGRAVRTWAMAEPARYGLLFGTPVPGYEAPRDQTIDPGTRVIAALVGVYVQAYRAGLLEVPAADGVSDSLRPSFEAIRTFAGADIPDWLIGRGLTVWTGLFGAVTFEVFGQYGQDTIADPEQLFEFHLTAMLSLLGLRH